MRPCRIPIAVVALTMLATSALAAEPLEELQDALKMQVFDPKNDDEVAFRKTTLEKRAKALSLADMPSALRLLEWKDEDKDETVAVVDRGVRSAIIERCKKEMAQVLAKGSTDSKLAAITAIAEMGINLRAAKERTPLGREFAPELIKSLASDSGVVRQAAARALGKIFPDGKPASAALGKLLESKEVEDRRAAADGLAGNLRLLSLIAKGRASSSAIEPPLPGDQVETTVGCVVAGTRGLTDDDAKTRQYALEVLQLGAEILHDLIGDPPQQDLPPPERKRTEQEEARIKDLRITMETALKFTAPLTKAVNERLPAVGKSLTCKDADLQIAACATLEAVAETRQTLVNFWQLAVRYGAKPIDEPFTELVPLVPKIADLLKHKEVKVRLAALYVLETLETLAAPAASALFEAVGDPDPFVRWGIARALGKLAPQQAEVAVPGLAKLIDDPNGDVRITALAGLERFGKAARTAVPRLDPAVNRGDVETRYWVIQALAAIGKDASPAVPALATALADKEVKLRLAAARALRKIGPTDAAVPALRKALEDPDAEVRRAASEALLAK